MTVQEAVAAGTKTLVAAQIDSAAKDARLLMGACLNIDPARVILYLRDPLPDAARSAFFEKITARAQRLPLSHLLGYRDFFGRRFAVTSAVLDPRPETETLVAAALEEPFSQVLDLGVGSGAILVSLLAELPGARGVGADLSPEALEVAQRNADAHGVAARCTLIKSNWFTAIDDRFDLIVSNPPYIAAAEMPGLAPELAHEPSMALTDGGDGLGAYRAICSGACAALRPGGRLMVEIGATQGPAVAALFEQAGLKDVALRSDLDGRDRVVSGRHSG